MMAGNFKLICFGGALVMLLTAGMVVTTRADSLLATDFETDPLAQGWTTNGTGTAWTTNAACSGTYSLTASNGGTWLSPRLPIKLMKIRRFRPAFFIAVTIDRACCSN